MIRNLMTAIVGAALLLAGAGSAGAQSKLNLRLDWSLYGTHAAFYLGNDNGLYKEQGIDLTISEGSGSGTTARLLAQGADPVAFLDFGTMAKGVGCSPRPVWTPPKSAFSRPQRERRRPCFSRSGSMRSRALLTFTCHPSNGTRSRFTISPTATTA